MNKQLFLPYVFTFTAWNMAMTTSRQGSILKIEESVKVLSYRISRTINFCPYL
jgi:hypothetical protein